MNNLSPPVKYFVVRSRAVLFLWIICVICVLCLSCFRVCSLLPCGSPEGKVMTSWLLLVMLL